MNNGRYDINKIMQTLNKNGINNSALNKLKTGDSSELLKNLSLEDKNKIMSALNNKEQLNKILSDKNTMNILRNFTNGGNKNG